jgi:hypothetical protein
VDYLRYYSSSLESRHIRLDNKITMKLVLDTTLNISSNYSVIIDKLLRELLMILRIMKIFVRLCLLA